VWVADGDTNSITQLDASTGDLVRVIPDVGPGIDTPCTIAAAGGRLGVANGPRKPLIL